MRAVRWFGVSDASVSDARRFALEAVADLPDELRDPVALMVSELATNAVVHASTGFGVWAERSPMDVRIAVIDQGTGTPVVQSPPPGVPHGRGLRIVEALSDEWGVGSSAIAGNQVWFLLKVRPGVPSESPEGPSRSVPADGVVGPTFPGLTGPRSAGPDTAAAPHDPDSGDAPLCVAPRARSVATTDRTLTSTV